MKKFFCTFFLCMLTAVTLTVSARAAEDTLRVGLNYGGSALYKGPAKSSHGLIAYKENCTVFSPEIMLQMMADTSGLAHAGCGKDYLWFIIKVNSL